MTPEEFDRLIDNLQARVNALRDELTNHRKHINRLAIPRALERKLLIDWGADWAAIEENGERVHEDHVAVIFETLAREYVGESNIDDNWDNWSNWDAAET